MKDMVNFFLAMTLLSWFVIAWTVVIDPAGFGTWLAEIGSALGQHAHCDTYTEEQ
jgi:hypothetical protein